MPRPNTALVEARLQRGMSQKKLADAIGVSLSTVVRWEKGMTRPFAYHQRKLAEFFGKTSQELGFADPPSPLQEALTPLADAKVRLPLPLSAEKTDGDPPIASPIATSEALLDEATRLALSRLAVLPPKPLTFSGETAQAIAGCDLPMLHALRDVGLLEAGPDGRFQLHPMMAAHSKRLLPLAQRQHACERFLAYLLQALDVHRTDRAWLAQECQMMLFAIGLARELEKHHEMCSLVLAFAPWMVEEGWVLIALDHIQYACDLAKRLQMTAVLPRLLLLHGQALLKSAMQKEAIAAYREGVRLARLLKDTERTCTLLASAAQACELSGEYLQAERYLREAWELTEANQLPDASVAWLWALQGVQDWSSGEYVRAEAACFRSIALFQRLPEEKREHLCLPACLLGILEGYRGHYEQADELFQWALLAAERSGPKDFQIFILGQRGLLYALIRPSKQLREELGTALLLARDLCAMEYSLVVFRAMATVELALGNLSTAERTAQQALRLTRQLGTWKHLGEILVLLARIALASEESHLADRYLTEAWPLVEQFCPAQDQAEAQEVRVELALKRGERAAWDIASAMAQMVPTEHRALRALACYSLARCMAAAGHKRAALRKGEKSLQELEALGHIRAPEVREWFASLQSA